MRCIGAENPATDHAASHCSNSPTWYSANAEAAMQADSKNTLMSSTTISARNSARVPNQISGNAARHKFGRIGHGHSQFAIR